MDIKEIRVLLQEQFADNINWELNNENTLIESLLTDSRNHFNPENTLFFAIRTEGGNDGHKYLKELYDKGVRNFVVEKIPDDIKGEKDINYLVVQDTVKALSAVGRIHRQRAKEVVAITGSRGKTTLKEMIFQLMEPYKKISRSPRSFNSKIGVPLSLWQISKDSDLAIIEAGISKRGEMENLSSAIQPDTVIITNIGDAHSNGFESKEEKAGEKSILAKGASVSTVIYPYDSALIRNSLKDIKDSKRLIGWSFQDPCAELYFQIKDGGLEYNWKGEKHIIEISFQKDYDKENIAAAVAFMLKEGINPQEIKSRINRLQRIKTRLNVSEGVNRCSIILDSYTSDLSSLIPAIDFMGRRKMPYQSQTLLISDLHYEGTSNRETYKEMAQLIRTSGIQRFIGIGKTLKKYSDLFPEGSEFFEDTESFLKNFSASDFNDEIILLKGSAEYKFEKILEQLEAKKHETVLEVNLDAILRNYNYFRSKIPSSTGVIAMVKASGYGAGSYEIAKTLQDAGASYLAVAALDEGIELRNAGIIMPIMVMNPRAANYRSLFKNKLEPVVYSLSMLYTLIEEAGKYGVGEYPVHIKLDTGMHRMGFEEKDTDLLGDLLVNSKNIKVASIFSHLATADCLDMDYYTYQQIERFERMSKCISKGLNYHVKRHILNSVGILRFPDYHYDYVRLGIGLYGANTLPPEIEKPLATVSSLRSVIITIREIEDGEAVGYGRKGEISGKRRIATIPIGYADGMNRKFGNGAVKVYLNGQKVPTIGNICMDATMLDVTGIDCKEGDIVEIFGENISVQTLADTLDTIPYEILTSVSPRVKRVYYRE